jgi:hypothetical protein
MGTAWQTLNVGALGFTTGIDIAADGTKVCRIDVFGAYRWNGSRWVQLVTTVSMPAAHAVDGLGEGVYEIRIAPSQTSRLYMMFGGRVFRSDNSGVTWSVTAFTHVDGCNPNDQSAIGDASPRVMGYKMAVDPNNADVVYVGTGEHGLWVTHDAGATWAQVAGVPTSTNTGGVLVAFDPSSSVVGGKTQIIYASSYGNGVYRSANGGASWALTSSSPTTHIHLTVGPTGIVYLTDNGVDGSNLRIYNGSWSANAGAGPARGVAVDPSDANHITVQRNAGEISTTINGGSSWSGYPNNTPVTNWTASDLPILEYVMEGPDSIGFMSLGTIAYDPSQSNKLYAAEGVGVWVITPPTSGGLSWTSQTLGIEDLVANQVIVPPGGKPLLVSWDRPVIRIATLGTYPSTYGPTSAFAFGAAADWASNNPTFIAALLPSVRKSSDGGATWSAPAAQPTGFGDGGCIAAASSTNFVCCSSDSNAPLQYTTDGGASWNTPTISGVPTSGNRGWASLGAQINRHIVCADRINIGTFYAFNNVTGADGVYRSTDGGANWTLRKSGRFTADGGGVDGFHAKMRCVPGNAGHLCYTGGDVTPGVTGSFFKCTDGGATWSALSGVTEVRCFGFGKPKIGGGGYPTVFIVGWVGGTAAANFGIWRSDDFEQASPTWNRISDGYPLGLFDTIKWIEGDPDTYGQVYVGFQGSGFAFGSLEPEQSVRRLKYASFNA